MIIVNAGVPRSGTILVNAFVRHLIGVPVRQENLYGAQMEDRLEALCAEERGRTTLVHAHDWTDATLRLVRTAPGFLNMRDPRDVALSLAKLHDLSLDEAAQVTLEAFASFARALERTDWMVIRYEQLAIEPNVILACIADELGVSLPPQRAHEIIAATSARRHTEIMRRVASGQGPRRALRNPCRTLWEDPETLINDRHIQSGAVGRWRTELSPCHAAALSRTLSRAANAYGY